MFTGSCPEIYLEKAFKRLNNYKKIKLSNCETLGKTSIALDINHTLEYFKYKNKILILKKVIEQTLQI